LLRMAGAMERLRVHIYSNELVSRGSWIALDAGRWWRSTLSTGVLGFHTILDQSIDRKVRGPFARIVVV
jgi:hypothetical protein